MELLILLRHHQQEEGQHHRLAVEDVGMGIVMMGRQILKMQGVVPKIVQLGTILAMIVEMGRFVMIRIVGQLEVLLLAGQIQVVREVAMMLVIVAALVIVALLIKPLIASGLAGQVAVMNLAVVVVVKETMTVASQLALIARLTGRS